MKKKHNKKRNTAFLFETLVRELTKAFVSKDSDKSRKIKTIFKESFNKGSALMQELDCYKALQEKSGLDKYTAEKLIFEAKSKYNKLDKDRIFSEQSAVIKKINHELGSDTYNNFVPNYKTHATLAQIFGDKLPVKNRVLLESEVLERLTSDDEPQSTMKHIDTLVVKTFTKKFNDKYSNLLESQRELLQHYITSFLDNGVDFKIYLGEQLKNIRKEIESSLNLEEVKSDIDMVNNTKQALTLVEKLDVSSIGKKELIKVLRLQKLIEEYKKDAN
jgi:hypothetical protein